MFHQLVYNSKIVHYRDEGNGPALILLHGFMESLEIWKDYFTHLIAGFRVVAIDLPGHGRSESHGDAHPMWLMADCVNAVVEELSLDKINIVGHSMGGYVSLAFAKKYPDKISSLVLFHSSAAADTEEARENRRRTIAIIQQNHSGFINQFIPDLFAPENRERLSSEIVILQNRARGMSSKNIIAAQKGMSERESMLDLLISVDYPIMFILGSQDSRIPLQKVLAQAILPVHSEVLILGNVGHMGFLEAGEKIRAAVESFVERAIGYRALS